MARRMLCLAALGNRIATTITRKNVRWRRSWQVPSPNILWNWHGQLRYTRARAWLSTSFRSIWAEGCSQLANSMWHSAVYVHWKVFISQKTLFLSMLTLAVKSLLTQASTITNSRSITRLRAERQFIVLFSKMTTTKQQSSIWCSWQRKLRMATSRRRCSRQNVSWTY